MTWNVFASIVVGRYCCRHRLSFSSLGSTQNASILGPTLCGLKNTMEHQCSITTLDGVLIGHHIKRGKHIIPSTTNSSLQELTLPQEVPRFSPGMRGLSMAAEPGPLYPQGPGDVLVSELNAFIGRCHRSRQRCGAANFEISIDLVCWSAGSSRPIGEAREGFSPPQLTTSWANP